MRINPYIIRVASNALPAFSYVAAEARRSGKGAAVVRFRLGVTGMFDMPEQNIEVKYYDQNYVRWAVAPWRDLYVRVPVTARLVDEEPDAEFILVGVGRIGGDTVAVAIDSPPRLPLRFHHVALHFDGSWLVYRVTGETIADTLSSIAALAKRAAIIYCPSPGRRVYQPSEVVEAEVAPPGETDLTDDIVVRSFA